MAEQPPLQLPPYTPTSRVSAGRCEVLDPLRRRWVAYTPEERVRQTFCHFLIEHRHFPASLLANEKSLTAANGNVRRCDTVLYHPDCVRPRVIIEYKAPSITITEAVFRQIHAYNSILRADYLIVSNGLAHYCCHIDYEAQRLLYLSDVPYYEDL